MGDLHHELTGRDALDHLLTDALQLHPFDEFAGHLEVHVGGEEGGAHLLQGVHHVLVGEFADAAEIAQGQAQFLGEGFEHRSAVKPRIGANQH